MKYLVVVLVLFSPSLFAQVEDASAPLVTDRPGQSEAARTVRANVLQLESGAAFSETKLFRPAYRGYAGRFRESEITYNATRARYGLLDNLELRLGLDYVQTKTEMNGSTISDESTFSPLILGAKIYVTEEKGLLPEISALGHLNLPFTVEEGLRPDHTSMDFRFMFSHTLSPSSSIGYNLGARVGGTTTEMEYLYTLYYSLALSKKVGSFVELYGFLPEDSSAYHSWNAGFTYLFNSDLQGDASVGTGINSDQSIFFSLGISYRINNLF